MRNRLVRQAARASVLIAAVSCGGGKGIVGTPTTPASHTLTVGAGSGNGHVTSSDAKIDCRLANGVTTGPTCSATYTSAVTVALTATADADQDFKGWGGACS